MLSQMFGTLKKEIEASNKKRLQAQKEREEFRRRCEKSELDSAGAAEELRKLRAQKERLEGLCRALTTQVKQGGPSPVVEAAGGAEKADIPPGTPEVAAVSIE